MRAARLVDDEDFPKLREEADSLMCLADALAGFVRLALRDQGATDLLKRAKDQSYLKEV